MVHIISPYGAVSHHAPACIYLRLDDIQHFVLMICNSFGIDDIHASRRDWDARLRNGVEQHLTKNRFYDMITAIGGVAMKRIIESQITLLSQTNEISLPVKISYTDNEVEITLKYNNIEYCGTGSDYLWVDAFADLQRKLPHGIFLACCMTCRHGNMCPYGNKENQLYCTKDVLLNSKDDVIELMDDKGYESFFEREVSSIHCCDDFIYQSDDCYTYNDYLYHLQEN